MPGERFKSTETVFYVSLEPGFPGNIIFNIPLQDQIIFYPTKDGQHLNRGKTGGYGAVHICIGMEVFQYSAAVFVNCTFSNCDLRQENFSGITLLM